MNPVSQWASKQGGWAHVVSVLSGIATLEFMRDPQFHATALRLWAYLPATAQDVIFLLVVLAALYARTQKPQQLPAYPAQETK